ncbi:aliphatic sulfonate ABC transporter substrate-binding protein [Clostridium polyendosporum]|uniref:Aliphatic sulfonate ABC transporter substrate-binding protein n=1 Tax=Clostridium polyendosporum TaxID=69208 RepID=A0A919VFI7_9CLOT|nr:ABC transporter substrate-binding protein [Clostridium polyendosporum]GIM30344.1 aliphatic sulfonate ABC transporter substrate-binding protein [Clostridium polyendosporum]
MKNTKLKKLLAVFSTLAVLTTSLYGCGSSAKQASTASDNGDNLFEIDAYGELDPQVSAQQIIADKLGYFKEEGLKVNNKLMTGPDQNAPLVASGTASVCFGSVYNNISVAANGIKVKVLAPLANAAGTQSVIARPGLKLTSAKDLEGKKIGMTSGAGVLIAIRNMCNELGVDINKIQFVNLQASEQLSALEKGDIDAMAVWEPWVGKAQNIGGTLLFSGTTSNLPEKQGSVHWIDFYMTVQATESFYNKHPEELKKFLTALKKATDYINNNPEEAAKIVAAEINIDPKDCLRIMKNNVYSMKFDDQFVSGTNTMANFMLDMKNISKVPDISQYTDTKILSSVDSSLVTAK